MSWRNHFCQYGTPLINLPRFRHGDEKLDGFLSGRDPFFVLVGVHIRIYKRQHSVDHLPRLQLDVSHLRCKQCWKPNLPPSSCTHNKETKKWWNKTHSTFLGNHSHIHTLEERGLFFFVVRLILSALTDSTSPSHEVTLESWSCPSISTVMRGMGGCKESFKERLRKASTS